MKKVLYSLMIVLILTGVVASSASATVPAPTIYVNSWKAGFLKITPHEADGSITIQYMLKGGIGWCMTASDVHVGQSLDDFPLDAAGADPDLFDFQVYDGPCVSNFSITLYPDAVDPQWAAGEHIYIAVHIVANNPGLRVQGQDGWAVRCGCIPGHIFPGTGLTLWLEIFPNEWE